MVLTRYIASALRLAGPLMVLSWCLGLVVDALASAATSALTMRSRPSLKYDPKKESNGEFAHVLTPLRQFVIYFG